MGVLLGVRVLGTADARPDHRQFPVLPLPAA
jgi:hypothetical protein